MNYLKQIIKTIIPFYSSYINSLKSTIHNQSYFGYVMFRLLGSCGGGVLSGSLHLYDSQQKKNLCRD